MEMIKTFEEIDHHRRRFFGTAAFTIAAAQLGMIGSINARPSRTKLPAIKPGVSWPSSRHARATCVGRPTDPRYRQGRFATRSLRAPKQPLMSGWPGSMQCNAGLVNRRLILS
jgi:hypothetical protein